MGWEWQIEHTKSTTSKPKFNGGICTPINALNYCTIRLLII